MRILMLVISDVDADTRVQREAWALHEAGHEVTIIALAGTSTAGFVVLPVGGHVGGTGGRGSGTRLRKAVRWLLLPNYLRLTERRFAAAARGLASTQRTDVVHAHDFATLPTARGLAAEWKARLVYDAHECWVGTRKDGRDTPLMDLVNLRREVRIAREADLVMTVSPMLAAWLRHRTGRPVEVVRNTFPERPLESSVPARPPSGIVYAGNVGPGRDLETLAAARLPVQKVVLGRRTGPVDIDLPITDPVPVDAVDEVYTRHGLALVPLTDDCLNHRVALPNKLFHAVRAGVPVVAADLPQLRAVVEGLGIGETYRPGDPRALEAAVARALERSADLGPAVEQARRTLTWETDAATLVEAYARL